MSTDTAAGPCGPQPSRPVLVIANGPVTDVHTQSGVPLAVYDELARRREVIPVDASLSPLQRGVAGATALLSTDRSWASARMHRSALATRWRSNQVREAVREGRASCAVVVRSTYAPLAIPYLAYIDSAIPHIARTAPDHLSWKGRRLEGAIGREGRFLTGAGHICTTGTELAAAVADEYRIPADRITVVGGGAHLATASRADPPPPPGALLFVGYDFRRKGGLDLLEAVARLRTTRPHVSLTIAGATPAAVPDGVTCLGPVRDRELLRSLYRDSSIFVMPSRWEPFGMALLEAMAMSLPCVSTSVNAIPDIVSSGQTGLLVAPGDVTGLTAAIARLVDDPGLAARMGEAGRRRVETEMRWSHVVDRIEPILDRLA